MIVNSKTNINGYNNEIYMDEDKNFLQPSEDESYNVYVRDKNNNLLKEEAVDIETDLGTRYFVKDLLQNCDTITIQTIGANLFGSNKFRVTAYYGEYYVIDRDKLYKEGNSSGEINDINNTFKGVHEGVDLYSFDNSDFYSLCDGYLVNDSKDDKYGTIAVYNDEKDITVLYLHAKKCYSEIKDNKYTKIYKGQKLGVQGAKGLSPGNDHVHIEIRKGLVTNANSSKDVELKSLYPYNYLIDFLKN